MAVLTGAKLFQVVSGQPWSGVRYFCTTRLGGVSDGPFATFNLAQHVADRAGRVAENRRRLRARLPGDPFWLNQIHGTRVVDADAWEKKQPAPEADAAVTALTNRVLAIMTADCLPVVIASVDGLVLGAAHAGWRGLAGGILEQTMTTLRGRHPDAAKAHWRAWVGPAISQRHFEVGDDVFCAFVDQDTQSRVFFAQAGAGRKWLADLPALARQRLYKLGVDSIELSGYCTATRDDLFYSYRRAAPGGRMATVAWLSGSHAP